MTRIRLASITELDTGQTKKFRYTQDGVPREGFLARLENCWVAYENRCRHIAISLDLDDGVFFTDDGKYFFCQTHGAVYEPETGLCVHGPCKDASLFSLPVKNDDESVWLEIE
ncbi:MAG: Rieske 2Fe-2S domain-containing protein [Verrucomicrobiota bacterium]|nr:Rieske 2Fe-2S domain-containing protein [Verrucomicrobiota bacterium]